MAAHPAAKPLECIIRPAKSMEEAHDLWWPLMVILGWNRASKDIITHYNVATAHLGQGGWLHAANKARPDNAEGCIVPFVFDNGTGWVGFFCMNAPLRGVGWGAKLFESCLDAYDKAGAKVVGLDGVEEQVKTYERRGFQEKAQIRLMTRKGIQELPLIGGFEHVETESERLMPLDRIPSHILVESDLASTGLKRSALWTPKALFDREDTWGLALVKEGDNEKLEGWIMVRQCQNGWRFGPLYANTKEDAKLLLHQAMRRLEASDGSYIVEVWESNPDAVTLFEESGWEWAGLNYHRMWLNGIVPEAQQPGGMADRHMFAIFDAAQG